MFLYKYNTFYVSEDMVDDDQGGDGVEEDPVDLTQDEHDAEDLRRKA